jgi:hypothetical protein
MQTLPSSEGSRPGSGLPAAEGVVTAVVSHDKDEVDADPPPEADNTGSPSYYLFVKKKLTKMVHLRRSSALGVTGKDS